MSYCELSEELQRVARMMSANPEDFDYRLVSDDNGEGELIITSKD